MDVTFTNVLEGARQYFQGLPTATSSSAGPVYPNSADGLLRTTDTAEQSSELPPSSGAYWTPPPQPEVPRPPTREHTPVQQQRPPSLHSDSSRPQSVLHEQRRTPTLNHYHAPYQEQQQQQQRPQSFQFPRPHSREAPSNVTTQHPQYQTHVMQSSPYHQPPSPQQSRTPTHQEQIMSPPSSSQSYHHLQNSPQASQGYHVYQQQQQQQHVLQQQQQQTQQLQQQQQQRAYYPVQSQPKLSVPQTNHSYKAASNQQSTSQENPYYKHLYSPHSQSSSQIPMQYPTSKPSLPQMQQQESGKHHEQAAIPSHTQTATSQAYRTTHNLPPIAELSANYHSSRIAREPARSSTTAKPRSLLTSTGSSSIANQNQHVSPKIQDSSASVVPQQNSPRVSAVPYSDSSTQQQNYRSSLQYSTQQQQSRLPVSSQNYPSYASTATTQSYSQVIVTTTPSTPTSSTYGVPNPRQSSPSTQQYYQHSPKVSSQEVPQRIQPSQPPPVPPVVVPQPQTTDRSLNGRGAVAAIPKQKRESPLDLSVKTVRTPADSTLDDVDHADSRTKYYGNSRTSSSSSSSVPIHTYPTYDVYANSFQRSVSASRGGLQSTATAPKVEFHPNFNVPTLSQSLPNNYRRSAVPDKTPHIQRPVQPSAYDKTSSAAYQMSHLSQPQQQQSSSANRYPTVSVPTAAHVNSYIQSTQQQVPKRPSEGLSRVDYPSVGHGHKAPALYPVPTADGQKKRPADTAPSTIIPNKMPKVDTWRQSIDQQIEQRFSSYKQQQQKHPTPSSKANMVNGGYQAACQDRPKDPYGGAYQKQQYPGIQSAHQPYSSNPSYQQHSQASHNQTYVPSAVAHQFPGYGAYSSQQQQQQQQQQQNMYQQQQQQQQQQHGLVRTGSNSSLSGSGSGAINKGNSGGVDKRVLSLLRNSLEIKGAKEAQKKLEQEQYNRSYENLQRHSRLDVQHPSTDVTAPLQPKPAFISRHNVSPFTPTNLPDGGSNTLSSLYKLHIPKAIDSVNFEAEPNRFAGSGGGNDGQSAASGGDRQIEETHAAAALVATQPNGHDLDGLAAFLAARIRTKAELKHGPPTPGASGDGVSQLHSVIENQLRTPSSIQDGAAAVINSGTPGSVSPPKLIKEQRQALPPRRRLFSRNEDDPGSLSNNNVPFRDKSGLRSSSETSVFDFPDSDSETEMPVLERQTLEEMRRDRRSFCKQMTTAATTTTTSSTAEFKLESPERPVSPDDDFFAQACDSFMEQLKCGSGKKRGRRKKMEPDVLANLETMTKEKPLHDDTTIKIELDDEDNDGIEGAVEEKTAEEDDVPVKADPEAVTIDDDDSDVPLINCKAKTTPISPKRIKLEDCDQPPADEVIEIDDSVDVDAKVGEQGTPKKQQLGEFLEELSAAVPRPAKKPNFGDGSDFGPGWEEKVCKYKKSLRMPPSLIQVTRPPQYHRLSTSLPDLDPCPNSPLPSSSKLSKMKLDDGDSDIESNASFNVFNRSNYDSEGGSSVKSLPNTTKENSSILDKLLERYGARKKRKYKRREDERPKMVPKPEKYLDLLPSPKKDPSATDETKENRTLPVKGDVSAPFGLRKTTVENFKEVFLNEATGNVSAAILNSRTRTQARILQRRATIKEVFGEDRPASAPPVTCLEQIKIKVELPDVDDNLALSSLIRREGDTSPVFTTASGQTLKDKLLGRNKEANRSDDSIKVEAIDQFDDQDQEDDEDVIRRDIDSKSETLSIDGDESSVSGKKQRNKLRRKFSSGFDYIRKKKKQVKREGVESETAVKAKKRTQFCKTRDPGSVQDIQKEIKNWVLNKGIGETHLHRSARLGYTDITAYCLEKMECSPSPRDNAGYTPLHEASARGHLDIARMLLMYGANVSDSARGGIRPLHEAVENGCVEIVRLLLSYGADPVLATYSGMTPLALATDESTIKLLQDHIMDVQGQPGSPFRFTGPASCFEPKDNGYDVLDEVPDPALSSSEEDELDFEVSDSLLPNLYTLHGEPQADRWILLQDLSSLLKIKSRDALLRQICPAAPGGATGTTSAATNHKSVLRELKMSDFLEQAHCCQFLNSGEKINTRASKIALVKYTDKVKELLDVEKITISVR